ncbi:DNA-binding transcriptional regulator, AcrR family [Nocardioides exalbidus]|uniref:DNA-binding transcriptional regulator, AcrR family n=1 Tax=Nocardioides exalbidus TaxID=402596 RepID=A0A1H4M6N7_9ACTN|nr:TetR/AcrR family transcriptional regulator [Nocardioides exalbidus]SEB78155.1 DNA-binding transcriptional regulator, AcrR family [Nocardioides exalbidus]
MPTQRKARTYDASARRAAAEQTRARVLAAAHDLFVSGGYAATSVSEIARRAGVSVDTVYTAVGRKPQLLLTVVDMVLASSSRPLPATERDYVQEIRRAEGARRKLETYAAALARLMPTISPLLLALRDAGLTDPECAQAWRHITERRATNMLQLAADLRVTGEVRDDLTDQDVADLVWSTNSPEWFAAYISRGRTPEHYAAALADLWGRTLLAG